MTLPDLDELLLPYLAAHPPTHILVAGFVGFKPRRGLPAAANPAQLAAELGLGHGGDVHQGLGGAAILDFAALGAASKRSA